MNLNKQIGDIDVASVLELFETQAENSPESTAIVQESREISYSQLRAYADRIAQSLLYSGVKNGSSVGICMRKCPEAIAAMLATMKVGAAFVPLDPDYPLTRIQYMIEDAGIQAIATDHLESHPLADFLSTQTDFAVLDCTQPTEHSTWSADVPSPPGPTDLAYIMYTSGSTGHPKGVQIEHRALLTYCLADIEAYRLNSEDRTLQFSTLNFDIAIEEIFPPLLIGSCVVIRPNTRSASSNELSEIIDKYDVSAVHLATAYWHEWVDLMLAAGERVPRQLRLVIATGEKVSVEHYRRWQALLDHEVLWCNAYGPTEATVTATVFIPDATFDAVDMPIGKPLPGYTAYILNEQLNPITDQQTGELYIGGPALARGYLNLPEKTAAAFVTVDLPGVGPTRLYRTGDLARWLPSGDVEFAGRVDHQIKLGSYRIEPGEIESAINRFPGINDSLVLHEKVDNQKHLIAYLACGQNKISLEELSHHLRSELPAYMLTQRFVLLDCFPKTANGKVDRDALPPASTGLTPGHNDLAAPRTTMQKQLAAIWSQVLQIPEIGIHDDFFALGGSSLLVTRVISELTKRWNIELPVRDFFANPTIASSAQQLEFLLARTDWQSNQDDQANTAQGADCDLNQSTMPNRPLQQVDGGMERKIRQLPTVKSGFIPSGQQQLFYVLYEPCESCLPRDRTVLICHPWGHEYARAYRNLQQLALQLCQRGYRVYRFDYAGTGNSSGLPQDASVTSMVRDIHQVAKHAQANVPGHQLTLIGIRLGATLATKTNLDAADQIILWDPIVNGNSFLSTLETLHQAALTGQCRYAHIVHDAKPGQFYGHRLGQGFIDELRQLKLPDIPEAIPKRHLLLTSEHYAQHEVDWNRLDDQWNVHATSDAIYWHDPDFTESAFASPEAYRQIRGFCEAS